MDEVKLLHQKKVRQQLRFLQLELEETKILYKRSIERFNHDFRKFMLENPSDYQSDEQQKLQEDENLIIETEVDEDTFKKMYRKVAGKTHPDKGGDDDKFKEANEANRNGDLGKLMEMADDLGVEVPMDDDMIQNLKKQNKAVLHTIEKMKTTMAWTWNFSPHEQRKDLKEYILHQLKML
jgi:hypothetical protein